MATTIVTFPSAPYLKIKEYAFGVQDYGISEMSEITGDSAERILGPSRWTFHMVSNSDMTLAEASRWEVLTLQLRGDAVLAAHDVMRAAPRGTMRGSPTLNASIAIGDKTMQLTGSGTLLQGDWLQVGTGFGTSQLVKVAADVTFSGGLATVSFENAIRKAYAGGTTVVWDKPVAYFKRMNRQATLGQYNITGQGQGDFSLDFIERFG